MDAYSVENWSEFAVAHVGAAGVLVGLVFVALSINLREIVASSVLVNRAIECILLFFSALVSASFVLLPGQPGGALATEMIVLAVAVAGSLFVLLREGGGEAEQVDRALHLVLAFASPLLLAIGGISIAADAGGGLFWWTGSLLFAYLAGLSGAWVLLVEILR